jgi:hypothetical protein
MPGSSRTRVSDVADESWILITGLCLDMDGRRWAM